MSLHETKSPGVIGSVLILEDEALLATLLEELVREMGAHQVHLCTSLEDASRIARTAPIDVAILDVHVQNGDSLLVADILAERGVPFLFSTADVTAPAGRHGSRPALAKPFADAELKRELMRVLGAEPVTMNP